MNKKIIATIMSLILVIGLCSCGGPTPTETVDSFLTAVKSSDAETIKTVYSDDSFEFLDEISGSESDDEFDKELTEKLVPKIIDFDYELSNEKIDGDKATVDVTFTTYNIGTALTSFMTEYFSQALALAFSDTSDEQMEKIAETLFKSKLDSMEKNYTDTVTVSLTKKDNAWVIDEFADQGDFYDAFLGGAITAVKDLEEAYDFEE